MVDPEPCGRPQREAVNDHIGGPGELIELLPALDALQIDAGTALTPVPHPIPGLLRKWIAQGRLDPHNVSSIVGKEHRGHRAGHAPGQVGTRRCSNARAIRLHPFTFCSGRP